MWPRVHAIRKRGCGWWVYDVADMLTTLVSMSFGFAVIKSFIRARCASVFAKASTRQAAQSRTASGICDKRVPSLSLRPSLGRKMSNSELRVSVVT